MDVRNVGYYAYYGPLSVTSSAVTWSLSCLTGYFLVGSSTGSCTVSAR